MELREGDLVWATVDRIVGTVVFMKIDGGEEGTVIESEITSGRVKNIRDYVVPKKRVVCKVIRIHGDRIDLSMRRVSGKEQKEAKEQDEKERNSKSILKTVLKERAIEIISKIESENKKISEILEESKTNIKMLEKYIGKENAQKVSKILKTEKQKKAEVKEEIFLTTTESEGVRAIKETLKGFDARYVGAGKYLLHSESTDLKSAGIQSKKILEEIKKRAQERGVEFQIC